MIRTVKKFVRKAISDQPTIPLAIFKLHDLREKFKARFDERHIKYIEGNLDSAGVSNMIRSAELACYSDYLKTIMQRVLKQSILKTNIEKKSPEDILLLAEIKAHCDGITYTPIKED